ncbi:bifunctional nuclease family protein [Bacteroidales bacterium]
MEKIALEIVSLSYSHSQSGAYALILEEVWGSRRLPIIIGGCEAQAIALGIEKITPNRPMTHDLIHNLMEQYGISLDEVYIHRFDTGIFYAVLICYSDGITKEIDVRTSDAVALALRFGCKIYTNEEIMQAAGIIMNNEEPHDEDSQEKDEDDSDDEFAIDDSVFSLGLSDSLSSPLKLQDSSDRELEDLLKNAIENEDYEKASIIRDEIKRRKKS